MDGGGADNIVGVLVSSPTRVSQVTAWADAGTELMIRYGRYRWKAGSKDWNGKRPRRDV
jgi:hypothetical protein